MTSTSTSGRPVRARLVIALCVLGFPLMGSAAEPSVPHPPELERDVQFWISVYTKINTNSGFLHDERNLSVIYDTVHFTTGAPAVSYTHLRAHETPEHLV